MHFMKCDPHLTRSTDMPAFARLARTATQGASDCMNPRTSPAMTKCRRDIDRSICLIAVLILLHLFTTTGWAKVPSLLPGTSASPTLAPLVKKILPSVVSITVKKSAPIQDSMFLNSIQFPDAPYGSTDREVKAAGVVVDGHDGLIVTNTHVIEQADDISVTLSDGRRFQGIRVDADPNTDIAVIRIAADNLVALPMANSDMLEVGDYLVAVGNPFGMGTTVSHGIVSALHRSGLRISGDQDFIQTDAPLNPGNSGGPLVNLRGELVGIATAITGPTGSNVGIGFAIPANRARVAIDRAVKHITPRRVKEQG